MTKDEARRYVLRHAAGRVYNELGTLNFEDADNLSDEDLERIGEAATKLANELLRRAGSDKQYHKRFHPQ